MSKLTQSIFILYIFIVVHIFSACDYIDSDKTITEIAPGMRLEVSGYANPLGTGEQSSVPKVAVLTLTAQTRSPHTALRMDIVCGRDSRKFVSFSYNNSAPQIEPGDEEIVIRSHACSFQYKVDTKDAATEEWLCTFAMDPAIKFYTETIKTGDDGTRGIAENTEERFLEKIKEGEIMQFRVIKQNYNFQIEGTFDISMLKQGLERMDEICK